MLFDDNLEKNELQETVEETTEATETAETTATQESAADSEDDGEELVLDLGDDVAAGTAHDDYDWNVGNRNGLPYSKEEIDNYLEDYEASMSSVAVNEVVKGKVANIQGGDIILDLGFKSDGILAMGEFRDMPDLAIGDSVDVYVESQENEKGQLVLSRRKAKLLLAWDRIKDSYKNGTVIKGTIISKTKGGLIADTGGLETFLPGSQIDIKPVIDYDSYVGKTMEFKVVKINEQIKNAVVSHKALIESDLAEQREQIIAGLERGQVLEGVVKNITDFGAFLDLGGVDGLLYITDIS
ncbi:MAG: S1 RNA-binding domain-containing protein, partial [Bacteroidota bacterium]